MTDCGTLLPIPGSALITQALSFKFHQPLSISDAGILPRILVEGIALRNFATLYAHRHETIARWRFRRESQRSSGMIEQTATRFVTNVTASEGAEHLWSP